MCLSRRAARFNHFIPIQVSRLVSGGLWFVQKHPGGFILKWLSCFWLHAPLSSFRIDDRGPLYPGIQFDCWICGLKRTKRRASPQSCRKAGAVGVCDMLKGK